MENLLLRYMDERVRDKEYRKTEKRQGPVLTISREAGCGANIIAEHILQKLKSHYQRGASVPWRIVNKEIVMESARELRLAPERIEYVFKSGERKMIDEILDALSNRYHKSDTKIRKTIAGVIRTVVDDGYVILVGRGGVAFTKGHPRSLNIMLQAPLEWRIQQVTERKKLTEEQARSIVLATDKERRQLVDSFYGSRTNENVFDVIFNCATFSIPDISDAILQLMQLKKFL